VALERIQAMLESCATKSPLFPPTELYNEGWLLRLVVDWFSGHEAPGHFLSFPEGGKWFSEALLPSAFLPRYRGDKLAESWTHADGVIGHFDVGAKGKADITLNKGAAHFVVIEAKIFSGLSSRVANASYYDQAARTVACIAEVLKRARRSPSSLSRLGFYVLAPESQIRRGIFDAQLEPESMKQKVKQRVDAYAGERDDWYSEWFQPTLARIDLRAASWEDLIGRIGEQDTGSAEMIEAFYGRCIELGH
jgi:hypothetical protein